MDYLEAKAWGLILGVIAAIFLLTSGGCDATYSEGSRVGSVTKFSNKGFIFKSLEGEMLTGATQQSKSGITVAPWEFTCKDASFADEIMAAMEAESKVRISYRQVFARNKWTMDTSYIVTKVEVLSDKNTKGTSAEKDKQ